MKGGGASSRKDEDSTGWTEGYRKRTEFRDTALRQSRYRPHAQANGRRVALVCLVIVGSQSIVELGSTGAVFLSFCRSWKDEEILNRTQETGYIV